MLIHALSIAYMNEVHSNANVTKTQEERNIKTHKSGLYWLLMFLEHFMSKNARVCMFVCHNTKDDT